MDTQENKIKLLEKFRQLQILNPFENIESPIKWQRDLRDEWTTKNQDR